MELKQDGAVKYTAAGSGIGVYTAAALNGTYDVFVNSEDTGSHIVINDGANSAEINHYTVNFEVANAGEASGSTVSASAGGSAISSGTAVLSRKNVEITALGSNALRYEYLWSGAGTSGQTTSSITIPVLSSPVNATCAVTGSNPLYSSTMAIESGKTYTISNPAELSNFAALVNSGM